MIYYSWSTTMLLSSIRTQNNDKRFSNVYDSNIDNYLPFNAHTEWSKQ